MSDRTTRTLAVIGAIAAIFTILDYSLRWGLISTVWRFLSPIANLLLDYPFQTTVIAWLTFLTWMVVTGRTLVFEGDFVGISSARSSKGLVSENKPLVEPDVLREEMRKGIQSALSTVKDQIEKAISPIRTRLDDFDYTLTELEISYHESKKQVGVMNGLIKKLGMNIKRGWGSDDTLLQIKDYISNKGMPGYYFSDLMTELEKLPKEFTHLKNEISRLAQEKLYNPR